MSTENETARAGRTLVDTGVDSDPEPTGEATAVVVGAKRAPSANPKPRAKAKPAKADSERAPRSRRAPAKKAAAKGGNGPRSRRSPRTRDEASIPPTWSDLDEHGDRIVAAGDVAAAALAASPFDLTPLSPRATILAPEAEEVPALPIGRPWLSPYAKAAMGVAAAVFLVLGARGLVRHGAGPVQSSAAASVIQTAAAPVIDPTPDTIAPPTDTLNPAESAEDAKHASLAALEQGKLGDSVAAGERATALDPTDAEAWLILGAAYQDQGNIAAARRSYLSCTKQATRGEVRECTFLLQ